jgi:acetolactate synthase-1/2/3 large subunit
MTRVADLIVRRLREAGVHSLFGVPGGGSNLDIVESAGRAGLPFVLTSTETAGAIAALAQAEITGNPGACLTTLGPGAASVVNGVACAFLDRAPVIVFTDNHGARSGPPFEHQWIDQPALLTPVTKWSGVLSPDTASDTIERAIAVALSSPRGPVHLECPGDVASVDASVPDKTPYHASSNATTSVAVDDLEPLLARATKPLILVGLGARRAEDVRAIRGLCERRGVPAMVTYKAKGVVPDDHRWFAGVFTNGSIERIVIERCDLLVGVGLDPVELLPRPWLFDRPIVSCCPWSLRTDQVPFAAQLVTDIPAALERVDGMLRESRWDSTEIADLVDRQRAAIEIPTEGLSPQDAVTIASGCAPRGTRVTVDAGAHMFPATMLWPVRDANEMLISNGLSTMGFAVPAAIGAALIEPERPVVAVTGDGGLLMCAAELLTAVRERLRIVTVVFSDRSLSLIDIKQQAKRYRPAGVDLGAISWPGLATSFGVRAFCAETGTQLEAAIGQALASDGPTLVEARINPEHYGGILTAIRG